MKTSNLMTKCLEKTMILSNMMMRKGLNKKRIMRKYNTSLKSKKVKSKRTSRTQDKSSGTIDKQEAYLYDNIFLLKCVLFLLQDKKKLKRIQKQRKNNNIVLEMFGFKNVFFRFSQIIKAEALNDNEFIRLSRWISIKSICSRR